MRSWEKKTLKTTLTFILNPTNVWRNAVGLGEFQHFADVHISSLNTVNFDKATVFAKVN